MSIVRKVGIENNTSIRMRNFDLLQTQVEHFTAYINNVYTKNSEDIIKLISARRADTQEEKEYYDNYDLR